MIKSVVHLNNKNGYIVHYETEKKAFTRSFCENKVPKIVRKFIESDKVVETICENSLFYTMRG